MPARVSDREDDPVDELRALTRQVQLVANLLALVVVKEIEEDDPKIALLSGAGFRAAEIGALLGKKPNTVSVSLHRTRKRHG